MAVQAAQSLLVVHDAVRAGVGEEEVCVGVKVQGWQEEDRFFRLTRSTCRRASASLKMCTGNGRTGFQPVSEHGLEARATRELDYLVHQNPLGSVLIIQNNKDGVLCESLMETVTS